MQHSIYTRQTQEHSSCHRVTCENGQLSRVLRAESPEPSSPSLLSVGSSQLSDAEA